jgi:hypothetical protein
MIWCLFSIANEYDQPKNNLAAWWLKKPTFEQLAEAMGDTFPSHDETLTIFTTRVWQGGEHRNHKTFDTWRLELVPEGILTY